MTDEERAEEYADDTRIIDENTRVGDDCISLVQDFEGNTIDIHERIKRAFLDGFHATKWHYPSRGEYPTERDWYLGVFEEADTGFRLVPVVCDYLGKQTKATTKEGWIINKCTDVNDTDPLEYYVNLKCVAWMPLPEPPKEEA